MSTEEGMNKIRDLRGQHIKLSSEVETLFESTTHRPHLFVFCGVYAHLLRWKVAQFGVMFLKFDSLLTTMTFIEQISLEEAL